MSPVDMGMLDLFRMEAQTHGTTLRQGLDSLTGVEGEERVALCRKLARAAQSIKGAARIIGLEHPARLAQAMESLFERHSGGEGASGCAASVLPLLGQCVDIFLTLADLDGQEYDGWLETMADAMEDLTKRIADWEPGEEASPKEISPEEISKKESATESRAEDTVQAPALENPPVPEDPAVPETLEVPENPVVPTAPEVLPEPAQSPRPAPVVATPVNIADASLLDLFVIEAQTHGQSLDTGLVELEKDQRPELVEPLMRAAHSLKGAARIVGLDNVVVLAHAMEDVLEACRKQELVLTGGHIDLLLKANDLFLAMGATTAADLPALLASQAAASDALAKAVRESLHTPPVSVAPSASGQAGAAQPAQAASAAEAVVPASADSGQSGVAKPDVPQADAPATSAGNTAAANTSAANLGGVVRVSSQNLYRIMGLAGESLVEARSLFPFLAKLQAIRQEQQSLFKLVGNLRETVAEYKADMGQNFRYAWSDGPQEEGADMCTTVQAELERAEELIRSMRRSLGAHTRSFDGYARRMELLSDRLYNEVIASQMRPFSDGLYGYPRMIRDLARETGKQVEFIVEGENTPVDRTILEKLEAPLTHLLRNGVDHGLETPQERTEAGKPPTGTLQLSAHHRAGMLHIRLADDGRGIDLERIRAKVVERGLASADMAGQLSRAELMEFLFLPGFSTAKTVSEISGRGVGLDVVHSIINSVGGSVRCTSEPGQGMVFNMQLPLTLSVLRTLLVEIDGAPLAVPLNRIDRVHKCVSEEVQHVEDHQYIRLDGDNVGLLQARQVLGIKQDTATETEEIRLLVISDRMHRYGLVVDDFLGERDLVVKPLDHRLGKVNNISSASVLDDGEPVLIADVDDLVRSMDRLIGKGRLNKVGRTAAARPGKRVLVVDDSLTVREVQRRLLENNGYQVDTAVDGMDGLNALVAGEYDLVVTDVDMPRLNGIALVERIRANKAMASLPVMIVSYKDREEDRLLGMEAGANYYLTKSSFHDDSLLEAVRDLIGEA